jgi:hypothetical protein
MKVDLAAYAAVYIVPNWIVISVASVIALVGIAFIIFAVFRGK